MGETQTCAHGTGDLPSLKKGKMKAREEVSDKETRLFCGSHDTFVYCWNSGNGELVWKTALDSVVYSTPMVCQLSSLPPLFSETGASSKAPPTRPLPVGKAEEGTTSNICSTLSLSYVCASSSSGCVYLLDFWTGSECGSLQLPWEVFSSPAVVDNLILVGCRDNNVYCIECFVDDNG